MVDFGVAYHPAMWTAFFAAEASVSAGLTGLLFVAISINLSDILLSPALRSRAAKALSTLVEVLLVASLCLVPGQSGTLLGLELVVVGTFGWALITRWQHTATHRNPYIGPIQRVVLDALTQVSTLPTIVGGVSLMAGRGEGLYWLVGGLIGSLVAAALDAWVLLVEIKR
jgi:hypothetical protein